MKACDKPQTGGASVAFIAVALSFLQDEVGPHSWTETSMWSATDVRSCQTVAQTSMIWVDSDG